MDITHTWSGNNLKNLIYAQWMTKRQKPMQNAKSNKRSLTARATPTWTLCNSFIDFTIVDHNGEKRSHFFQGHFFDFDQNGFPSTKIANQIFINDFSTLWLKLWLIIKGERNINSRCVKQLRYNTRGQEWLYDMRHDDEYSHPKTWVGHRWSARIMMNPVRKKFFSFYGN